MASRARLAVMDITTVLECQPCGSDFAIKLQGGVAVFCVPKSYPSADLITTLMNRGIWNAIWIHPNSTNSMSEDDWNNFEKCLALPGVRALREVVLDYTVPPKKWNTQHRAIDRALCKLRGDQVLVLHARAREQEDNLWQLLYMLKRRVQRSQRNHLHCFTGNRETVDLWVTEIPNGCFGYTSLIASCSEAAKEALRALDLSRLLLETDSPFFKAKAAKLGSPLHLGIMANAVARCRGRKYYS
ncbi:putative deoxyribonuclease TATDN2 [Mya arenaria]|uniref:putative deoxyribonuclease TATDN2 n=1 Tax=Mya arenaria TaxID=6604 RepID=UPI0022E6573D|nr:putative deoxyribonuclease TATDN2 [Mya arenaria]